MTDLFAIEESTIDCCLVGLSKDGVEGFVAADVASGTGKCESDHFEESVQSVGLKSS
jgi:hypothetical protein